MKTVSIGDSHGLTVLDTILEIIDQHDKFIFVGDYVDSFEVDDLSISKNLYDLIELKKKYADKVVLLFGNHDVQYLLGYDRHGCSGYRPKMKDTLYDVFSKNRDLFQMAYQIDDTIWTHAGVHEGWYRYRFTKFIDLYPDLTLSQQLNLAFNQLYEPLFDVGYRRGGNHDVGGPFWCDMSELKSSPIRGYNQIVGHTKVNYIQKMNLHNKEIVFIDVLESRDIVDESLFYYKEI
jgi:hypothetical protein